LRRVAIDRAGDVRTPREPARISSPTGLLFIHSETRHPGAAFWIHAQLLARLDRRRHELHVACTPGRPGRPTAAFEMLRPITDVRIVPVNLGPEGASRLATLATGLPAIASLARLAVHVRKCGISLICTADRPRDAVAAVVLSRLTGVSCAIHCHVAIGEWMGRPLRWALGRADALVAVSEFVAGSLVDAGHDPERVHVVLNGIDASRWTPGARRAETRLALGIAHDAPVVLTVCRLFPAKGAGDLIRACADLRTELPDLQLLVVGADMPGEHYSSRLRALAAELDLGTSVRFLGTRDDVPELMAAADVFAMPSRWEPFGLVYAEAMAMELPVVALANGGTVEVVEHGMTGLLSEPDDHEALVDNLRTLLRSGELRRRLGICGRRTVLDTFTTDRMAADATATYERVLATAPGRSPQMGATATDVDRSPTDIEGCRQQLDEHGYVIFRDVVSPDRLADLGASLQHEYERASAAGELFAGGGSISGHLNCFPGEQSRFVFDELRDAGIVDLVGDVRPDIVESVRATLNFNLPGSVAQHYHADGLYTEDFLICNIAVVDTDLVNGALDVLPGTNRQFHKFWQYALHRRYRATTRVPMRRGDAILRKSTLWHRGMPNRSAVPRPMMAVTFGELSAPPEDAFGINGGQAYFFPNWYSTGRMSQLRERTFAKAPITYSAYRFARSLYGNKGYSSW